MNNLFPVIRSNRYNTKRDPFALSTIFDDFLNFDDTHRVNARYNTPKANIIKSDTGFVVELAAPGYSRDEFEMTVDNNQLSIQMKTEDTKNYEDSLVHQEYSFTNFKRSFSLPENTNVEGITARYDAGILYVNVPVENKTCTTRTITVE